MSHATPSKLSYLAIRRNEVPGVMIKPPSGSSTTINYLLRVSIKLRIGADPTCVADGTICTATEKTLEKPITFRRLGIPTVFAGFEHDDFGGAALIVVPDDSPLGSAGSVLSRLGTLLTGLSNLYDAVKLLSATAAWTPTLPNLDILSEAISHLPGGAVFRSADEIDELESITVVSGRCCGGGDADDFFNSVIFIGYEEKIQLFTDEGQDKGDDPWFSISTHPDGKAHVAVLVGNLDKNPGGKPSGRITEHGDNESFHDALSSLRFEP